MQTFNTETDSDFMKSQLAHQKIGFLIGGSGGGISKLNQRSSNKYDLSEAFNNQNSQMLQTDYQKKFLGTG